MLGDQRSTVHPLGETSTCVGSADFYDEDGVYHSHNWNTSTARFMCSNRHRFVRVSREGCHVAGCTDIEPVDYWKAA